MHFVGSFIPLVLVKYIRTHQSPTMTSDLSKFYSLTKVYIPTDTVSDSVSVFEILYIQVLYIISMVHNTYKVHGLLVT